MSAEMTTGSQRGVTKKAMYGTSIDLGLFLSLLLQGRPTLSAHMLSQSTKHISSTGEEKKSSRNKITDSCQKHGEHYRTDMSECERLRQRRPPEFRGEYEFGQRICFFSVPLPSQPLPSSLGGSSMMELLVYSVAIVCL